MIRMAWHAAGTYRVTDGRGGSSSGQQRFEPLNSWPDNGNLDKARRLLWPLKQKYGRNISWADLFILAGNVAIESMGGPVFGFAGGRKDVFRVRRRHLLGHRGDLGQRGRSDAHQRRLARARRAARCHPDGADLRQSRRPGWQPRTRSLSARDMKATFQRMAMNSEETVALTAGGHAFGKAHGAKPAPHFKSAVLGGRCTMQGLGWLTDSEEIGQGHITTSGIEGAWSNNPTQAGPATTCACCSSTTMN